MVLVKVDVDFGTLFQIGRVPVISNLPRIRQISQDSVALRKCEDFSRALVKLLHCWDRLGGVDRRIVSHFVLSFEDDNFLLLMLNVVEAAEGNDCASRLAHYVDMEHKFSVLWVAATALRDRHLFSILINY